MYEIYKSGIFPTISKTRACSRTYFARRFIYKRRTEEQAEKLAAVLSEEQDKIDNFAYYTGQGSPRFVLTFDPVLPKDNYAQFVITAKDVEAREYLNQKFI